jgi:hypothetical protein
MKPKLPAKLECVYALAVWCRRLNTGMIIALAFFFFLVPPGLVLRELSDPNLRKAGIPKVAWRMHRRLSSQYEPWSRERMASKRAAELSTENISGTEWPLFGSVFYLWATESLQAAWEKDPTLSPLAPKVYARRAVEAATDLVIDPTQASWVKVHWGDNYLHTQNVFYRMLVISALTSHVRLTGSQAHLALLRDQADSLAAELNASPHGLLDDYPGQCYPGDVLTSIAMIRRADQVLGTDHSAFAQRAIRGFQNAAADPHGMVPYYASARLGEPQEGARGCGNSYISLFAPEIWPDQARKWYDLYAKYFWQERGTCAGFREFPKDVVGDDWYFDVDSGPVWGGFGCSACAFGVGAARVNGHFEHAWPLTAEMLATSWPLPTGGQMLPRLLSNAADAPFLGESGILFNLTRLPGEGLPVTSGGRLPKFVLLFLAAQVTAGLVLIAGAVWSFRKWQRRLDSFEISCPGEQVVIWAGLVGAGVIALFCGRPGIAVILWLLGQFVPRWHRRRVRVGSTNV